MTKGWYVVHTYSGYENKVQKLLSRLMEGDEEVRDRLFDVKVPSEDVAEVRDGKKRVTTKRILPGYILVEMDLSDAGWKGVCAKVRGIQGVTGFVGTARSQRPQPISGDEARDILQKAGALKTDKALKPKLNFSINESVRIVDGPFDTFTGTIEEINQEKGKLRVMVGIFGRSTPVELDFLQVEKI